ncbi:four helix bundle protein [Mesotoga sp.]|uniref:four helix bundle protein n=1 Tax=Mesotoga sp. TaxID=2053577 RepID=UPI00345E6A2A
MHGNSVWSWLEGFMRSQLPFLQGKTYGLSSQLQRAAVSVPSNIAEGSGRNSRKEFVQFIYLSRGSLRVGDPA